MRFIHTPVVSTSDPLILQFHCNCFFNIVRAPLMPRKLNKKQIESIRFCDSGGYQIYMTESELREGGTKTWYIIPGAGIKNSRELLIIDPIEVCIKYGMLGVKYGFTVDIPLCEDATEKEVQENMLESFEWAKLMFQCRKTFCPETRLFIPLHYFTKKDLHDSFEMMATLNPEGYAIPVRETSNWNDFVRIAIALCFLHHREADLLHMFGSVRAEIIILGAAATGLGMFQQLSFDSTSWNTPIRGGKYRYFDSKTLIRRIAANYPQTALIIPNSLINQLCKNKTPLSRKFRRKLVLLHNVLAINHYTLNAIRLSRDISQLKRYVRTHKHLRQQRSRLLTAIDILMEGVTSGYGSVEESFDWLW